MDMERNDNRLPGQAPAELRRAELIASYTEMLVDLLSQREEWLLIVDWATREVVYCNKRPQGGQSGSASCESCRHRLPIQSRLLEWGDAERYKIWELEEKERGTCYRIISFPIEWRERPSCVHIVMDVTSEKLNARLLDGQSYQDAETGIRNARFLEAFMAQALRSQKDLTLACLELEGMEEIDASYGPEAVGAYLRHFVDTVRRHFRSGDTFARIGDDRFCLVLTGNVKHLIDRKVAEIRANFQRDDGRAFCHRCSFRYSVIEVSGGENTLSLPELLRRAEDAIHRNKCTPSPY